MAKAKAKHGAGAAATAPFAIMLDRWMDIFDDQWPITQSGPTVDSLTKVGTYDGSEPACIPRDGVTAHFVKSKTLRNTKTDQDEAGGIYELG
jgi:hypothetical protein